VSHFLGTEPDPLHAGQGFITVAVFHGDMAGFGFAFFIVGAGAGGASGFGCLRSYLALYFMPSSSFL
jgi:hypothetical protein